MMRSCKAAPAGHDPFAESILTDFLCIAGKIAKEYEAKGGDYENQAGSKNKAKKGAPEHKDDTGKLTRSLFVSATTKPSLS